MFIFLLKTNCLFIAAPLFLVTVLFYTDHFDCKSIAFPYLICFYLSMLNRWVTCEIHNFESNFDEIFFFCFE